MAFLISGGIWIHSVNPAHSANTLFTIQLPAASLDLSDLDVRDHNNRRVASPVRKNQLRALFEKSLTVLILENLTPAKRLMNFILQQSWNGAFGWLQTAVQKISAVLSAWISKSKWGHLFVSVPNSAGPDLSVRWRSQSAPPNFHSLIPALLSSTTLLR